MLASSSMIEPLAPIVFSKFYQNYHQKKLWGENMASDLGSELGLHELS